LLTPRRRHATFAIPEAHDEGKAFSFGNLTVHEVATHRALWNRAYLSYYAGGVSAPQTHCRNSGEAARAGRWRPAGSLGPLGNGFWGMEMFLRDVNGDGKPETCIRSDTDLQADRARIEICSVCG
jgi:hypothetical protein